MKTLILAILSIALLASPSCANDATPSTSPSENEYGIDPAQCYPGDLVMDLLRAAEDESVDAAQEAFDEGVKQGRIDGRDLWMPRYEAAEARAVKAEKRPTLRDLLLGVLGGFAGGALLSFGAQVAR